MSKSLQEALTAALDLEQMGHDYYLEVASNAKSPLTQRVFSALADQEVDHMRRIREIYESLESAEAASVAQAGSLEDLVKAVFQQFTKQERSTWDMDNAAAYECAMDLERGSYSMYDKLAHERDDPAEVRFFEALLEEESEHLIAIENVYNYLQHTGDWFASQESRVWNWMNM